MGKALKGPASRQDDQRSDDSGHNVSQRDRHFIEGWEQPQQSKQQTADESANQAQCQIPPNAKTLAVARDYQSCKAPTEQTDDYPDDELSE
jgi:hypothetical protein